MTKSGDLRPRVTEFHLTLGLHLIFKLPLESIKSLPVRTSNLKVHNFMKLSWITLKLSNHKVQVPKNNLGEFEDDWKNFEFWPFLAWRPTLRWMKSKFENSVRVNRSDDLTEE